MASIFNSKHNKYVSIPDWFKDTDLSTEQPAETKTTYIGGASGAVASGTGMSDIVLHNKFVLKEVTASSDILVIQDTALNVIESAKNEQPDSTTQSEEQTIKIGDELQVIGWGTSAYIEIAAGSTMTINASISELYGLVFYDNTKTVISGVNLSSSPIEVVVPINASYYRISSELNIDSFSILYQKPIAYNSEQLEISNQNITDYVQLNEEIPEGINTVTYTDTQLKLLVQSPLSLTKDINNVVKLSIGEITTTSSINDMFVWDKKLAAFGYDTTTGTAYSYIDGQQQFTTDEEGNEIPVTTTNSEFWQYDDSLENLWIIKSTRPRISWLDNLVEYNDEKNCFIFHGNVLTTGGITMYAEDGDIGGGGTGGTIPNLEELKKLFVTTDDLVQSITGIKTFENGLKIGTSKLYFKDDIVWLEGNLAVTGGITMYAQQGDIEGGGTGGSLLPGTIEEMVNALTPFFVTVDDLVQNVTGIKHFENGIYIGSVPIKQTSEDVIYIDANLVVRGGITMYAQENVDIPSFMESLLLDENTLKLDENGRLTVIGGTGGSIEHALTWSGRSTGSYDGKSAQNIYIPSKVSEFTNDSAFITKSALSGYATQSWVNGKGYATQSWVNDKLDDYVTELGLESNGKYDQYLTYTKGGTVNRLTVGYATYANRLLAFGATDLNATGVWNTNIGLKSSWFASSASNKPATAGTSANGVITFMPATSYGFQLAYLNQLSTGYDSVAHLFVRNYVNGSYKNWYRLVTDGPQMTFDTYASGYMRLRYLTQDWYYLRAYSDGLWIGLSNTVGARVDSGGNLLTTGGITMYSDERKKTILRHVELSLKEVADAPLIEHYYNSDDKKTTHVGSIAQYWAGLNDWFCKKDSEGFYMMEIQNAALASSISVARELLRYENETDRRIQLLEKENHILKNEIENLRKNK